MANSRAEGRAKYILHNGLDGERESESKAKKKTEKDSFISLPVTLPLYLNITNFGLGKWPFSLSPSFTSRREIRPLSLLPEAEGGGRGALQENLVA